ncbi:MAG TPA: hypothetical protein VIK18_13080, partial [Pirellulales bacterium]
MSDTAVLNGAAETSREHLERLLADCTRLDASDLHLAVDLAPYFRTHGVLEQHTHYGTVSAEQLEGFAAE